MSLIKRIDRHVRESTRDDDWRRWPHYLILNGIAIALPVCLLWTLISYAITGR